MSPLLEWNRMQQASAKSDIDKPTSIIVGQAHKQRKVVCVRYRPTGGAHDGGRDTLYVKANLR